MRWLPKFFVWICILSAMPLHAGYVLQTMGSGTANLVNSSGSMYNATVNFTAWSINRLAIGFGDVSELQPNVIEGAWFEYTFTVPTVDGVLNPNFDMQNTMGGLWSGMGGNTSGEWQRGPTTSTWNRAARFQHDYYDRAGANATIRPVDAPGLTPFLNQTLAMPNGGDVISVLMVFNAINNNFEYTYRNITTNEVFNFTIDGSVSGAPTSSTITFNNLAFRSDIGPITTLDYAYGSLHVIPEPTRMLLLGFGSTFFLFLRRSRQ